MLDGVSISIQGTGVGAQTFRRGLIIALAVLATGAAAVTVIASSHTNQLDVEVRNVNNFDMPGSGGELEAVVYNNDNAYTGQETYSGGESSVTVTVDGIADGDYRVEVYQTPDGGKGFEEYWGSGSVSLYDGYEKIDHTRDTQWMSHISINDQSPYDSTPTIVEGESVHIDIRATNSEQWAIDTYVRLFLDRNRDSTHDFESEHGPVTIDSGGDGWFGWDHTPEHTGTYYFSAVVKGTYSQKTRTDQHFWYPAFEVEPNEGDLKVYVEDENGNTESGADVVLYDSDWNELDTKTTNSNGDVKWTGLDPATYNLEAYGPKGAFWGSIQADVQQGEQTTKTLPRKAPWLKDVVFTDKGDGDGTYVVGETINIAPQVYNGESYDKNVRVEIWTDQDQSSPWDDHVTRGPITISGQSDGWFGRDFEPESSGTYYVRVQVESEYSDWAVTDVPGWVESFYVEPDTGDLKACVEDRNGNRVSDAIVKLYDDNWNYQGEKNANNNGCAKWSGIDTGSYNLEAYGPGGSFWGGLGAEVNQGEQTTKTIGRSTPWLETVTLEEQGDGDGTIEEGETVTVSPGAEHLESYGVDTKVQIWIDRDKSSPWDDDVTRGPIRIDPGETGWFGRDFQPPESGTYYVRVKVLADYGGPDWAVTDDPGWTTNFDVGTPESGQIDVRVEHPSGDLVKDSELNARVVYQDGTDSSPYRDPSDPGDGQFTVGNLPPGHDYTVTVYVNDMYAGATQPIGIQDGDQKSATITVHDQGRLTVQAYYDDGQTPLSDATVRVYSHEDSTVWREDTTTEDGQTQALWLMPTTRDGEHYHVKIYKGGAKVGEQDGVQLSGNGDQTVDITTTVSADSPRIVNRDPSSRDLDLQEGSERTFTVEVEDPDGALGDVDWFFSDADCNPIEGSLEEIGDKEWRATVSYTFEGSDEVEVGVVISDEGGISGDTCEGWREQAEKLWTVSQSPDDPLSLAKKYKPVFHFDRDEVVYPTAVEYAFDHFSLEDSGLTKGKYTGDDLPTSRSGERVALDNPTGDITFEIRNGYRDKGASRLEAEFQDEKSEYTPTVYARVFDRGQRDLTAIQYWLFYPVNNALVNAHEGDWEVVQVNIDQHGAPVSVYMSAHRHYGWELSWGDPDLKTEGSNVHVYVARGSHANYPTPDQSGKDNTPDFGDKTDGSKNLADFGVAETISVELIQEGKTAWLAYPGLWGEDGNGPGWNGPKGPKFGGRGVTPLGVFGEVNAWESPFGWAEKDPYDDTRRKGPEIRPSHGSRRAGVDEALRFEAQVHDQDCDLTRVLWYVDGDLKRSKEVGESTSFGECGGTASLHLKKGLQPGEHEIRATVLDILGKKARSDKGGSDGRITGWNLRVVNKPDRSLDAEIEAATVRPERVGIGRTVASDITISNSGIEGSRTIACSYSGPSGPLPRFSGSDWIEDKITIPSGEQTFQDVCMWEIPSTAPAGTYSIKVALLDTSAERVLAQKVFSGVMMVDAPYGYVEVLQVTNRYEVVEDLESKIGLNTGPKELIHWHFPADQVPTSLEIADLISKAETLMSVATLDLTSLLDILSTVLDVASELGIGVSKSPDGSVDVMVIEAAADRGFMYWASPIDVGKPVIPSKGGSLATLVESPFKHFDPPYYQEIPREAFAKAVNEGTVGGEVNVEPATEKQDNPRTSVESEAKNVQIKSSSSSDSLQLQVEASDDKGRTLLINLVQGSLDVSAPDDLEIKVDGERIQPASNYGDILNPDDDAGEPEYLVVTGPQSLQALVSIPHFSTRTIVVSESPASGSGPTTGSGDSGTGFSVSTNLLAGIVGVISIAGVAAYVAPRLRSRSSSDPKKNLKIPQYVTPGTEAREVPIPLTLEPFLPDLASIDADRLLSAGLRGGPALAAATVVAVSVGLPIEAIGIPGVMLAPFLVFAAAGLSGAAVHRWQGRQFTEPRRTAVVGLLVAGIFALTILALLPSQPSNAHVASVWNQAALPVALAGALIVFGILEVQSDEEDHETTDTRSRPRASSGIEELETALDDAYELIDEPPQDPEAIRDAVPGLVSRLENAADTDDELASEAIRVADRLRSTSIDQLLKRAEDQLDLAVREIRAGRDPSGPLNRALEAAELGTDLSPGREVRLEAVGAAASIVESAPPDQLARAVVTELADLSFKTDEAGVVEVAEDRGCRMLAAKLGRSLWDQLAQGEDDVDSRGWSPS